MPTSRIDYQPDDDTAPEPTTRVPGASVAVTDTEGRLLMIKRADSGLWALPGGGHEIGESLPDTAIRECLEETGLLIELDGIVGTFTNPRHIFEFRGDRPEIRQEFSVLFAGHPVHGVPSTSAESIEVAWIEPDRVRKLAMTPAMTLRLDAVHAYQQTGQQSLR